MKFTILGPPRTKKNHSRIVRNKATGAPFLLPSADAAMWTESAKYQLSQQWRGSPIEAPVSVKATFYRERAVGDLVNYMQALADALQAAELVVNDSQIVSWDGTRLSKDAKDPRVEFEIEVMT